MSTDTLDETVTPGPNWQTLQRLVQGAAPGRPPLTDDADALYADISDLEAAVEHACYLLGYPDLPLHDLTPGEASIANDIADYVAGVVDDELGYHKEYGFDQSRTDVMRVRVLRLLVTRFAQQL